MATKTVKNGTKKVATKAQAKKSNTPLLDAAKLNSPHQPQWNREAALEIAQEFAGLITADMTVQAMLDLEVQYKQFAGWTNCHEAMLQKFGLRQSRKLTSLVAAQ